MCWFLPLLLAAAGWAQQRVAGPLVLTVTPNSPQPIHLHTPFTTQFSALESFFRGASPQSGTRHDFTDVATWTCTGGFCSDVSVTGDEVAGTTLDPACNSGCAVTLAAAYGRLHASVNLLVFSPQAVTVTNVSKTQLNPLPQGEFQEFNAIAAYSDGFNCSPSPNCNLTGFPGLVWSSSNPAVGINEKGIPGLAEALSFPGSSTIGCIFNLGMASLPCSGPVTLSTAPPGLLFIFVTPRDAAVDVGKTRTFQAEGHYSFDGPPISISSLGRSGGVVTVVTSAAHGLGTGFPVDVAGVMPDTSFDGSFTATFISATSFSYVQTGQPDVTTFTPTSGTIASSEHTLPYTSGSDPQDTVTWAINPSNPSVATINANTGVATGVGAGIVGIVATPPQPSTQCLAGSPVGFACQANLNVGLTGLSISPTTNPVPLPRGAIQQFTVMGTFSDSVSRPVTNSLFWSSSAANKVSVVTAPAPPPASLPGLATATGKVGDSAIIAAEVLQPAQTCGTTALCVTATVNVIAPVPVSIAVTPGAPNIPCGDSQQFTATETFSDGSKSNVTASAIFNSGNPAVLTFGGGAAAMGGLAQTHQPCTMAAQLGMANVTASADSLTSPSVVATVSQAVIDSIKVTPKNPTLPSGTMQTFTAKGTYTDGTICTFQNCTADAEHASASVVWSSTVPNQVQIDPSTGQAQAIGASGSATIKATSGNMAGSTKVTVVPAALKSISLTPTSPADLPVGLTQQFTATGTFSDNSMQDLSGAVTWNSSSQTNAVISSSGLATAESTSGSSSTNISATYSGCTAPNCTITPATIPLTIVPATLTSIAVYLAPCPVPPMNCTSSQTLSFGQQQQFVAIGTFSAAPTSQDITSTVNWSTSDESVATIDASGLATAAGPGTASVIATDPVTGKSSNAGGTDGMLTVTQPTLVSVTVTPVNFSVNLNGTLQYTATGTYSDNSNQDLTDRVTWGTTSNGSIASIDASGLLMGNSVGHDTVTAACDNDGVCQSMTAPGPVNGNTPVTVSF